MADVEEFSAHLKDSKGTQHTKEFWHFRLES